MSNPYLIHGPAIVSFSGGRTSGFMLAKIVAAHDGTLPSDVHVCFNNTGLEHAATYEFVREVGEKIAPVVWLEYTHSRPFDADEDLRPLARELGLSALASILDEKKTGHGVCVVNFDTASRNGEPFEALVRACNYLPNPVTRKCSSELKIRTSLRYTRSLGWPEYTNAIGLRADEMRRVSRMKGDVRSEHVVMPMAEAGHTLADVLRFWEGMPFDLRLPGNDSAFGNCTGCFLKSKARIQRVFRAEPEQADWWIRMEALSLASKPSGARFRNDRPSYAAQLEIARTQEVAFEDEGDSLPCACTE